MSHQQPPQVAVTHNPGQRARLIQNNGHAQAFAGHLVHHVAQRRVKLYARHALAGVHERPHGRQLFAEPPARMQARKILSLEAFAE